MVFFSMMVDEVTTTIITAGTSTPLIVAKGYKETPNEEPKQVGVGNYY